MDVQGGKEGETVTGDWHPPAPPPLPGHDVCCPSDSKEKKSINKDRQAASEQAAREWLIVHVGDVRDRSRMLRSLVALLAAQRAAVLEEAASMAEHEQTSIVLTWRNQFAKRLRDMAQEQRP